MTCESCGDKPKKCNKDFTRTVVEIDNPEQIALMRKVTIPASMGDDTTVPPVVGKYKNVLLYYEANQKSYLYSSDGIPTLLANGLTDYEQAVNLPQINSHTLIGDKTGDQLGLQNKLTAGDNISIEDNVISATDTTYGPATDTEIGLVKPGDGLEVDANGELKISLNVAQSDWTEADNTELSYIKNKPTLTVEDYSTAEVNTNSKWIDDSSIYKKTVDIGSLPDTDTKTVAHGITGLDTLIKIEGYFTNGTNSASLPYSSPTSTKNVQVYIDSTNIYIVTGEDRTSYSGYVTVYYIKNS